MIPLLACNVLDTFNVLLLTKVKFTFKFDEMVLIIVGFIPVEMHSLTPTPHHAPRKINLACSDAPMLLTADWCRLGISDQKHVFSPKQALFDSPFPMPSTALFGKLCLA